MELFSADLFRDGGSIGARFVRDGEIWGLFLQVARWDHSPPFARYYGALRISEDHFPEHGSAASKGGDAEQDVLARLDAWLRAPAFAESFSDYSPYPSLEEKRRQAIELLTKLREQITKRLG